MPDDAPRLQLLNTCPFCGSGAAVTAGLQHMLLAAITHDVRSHLQAERSAAAVLQHVTDEKQRTSVLARLHRSQRRIERLLRSLLDCLTIHNGRDWTIHASYIDLAGLVNEVIAEHEELLGDRVIVEGGSLHGWWDHDALFSVVENLLLNAVKYGMESGEIACRLEALRGDRASLTVTNQGKPIPHGEWELIFQPFSRGHQALLSGQLGWGVGLAYARAVLTRHGGDIAVERSTDEGTTFAVTLPVDSRRTDAAQPR
jgi:signal transduction histidine kinase